MACDLTTIQTEACTSGIGKVTDTIELLQLIAQLTCEAGQTLGVAGNPSLPLESVQFNDGGVFGGDADFTWDKTTNALSILGKVGVGVAASTHQLKVQIAANSYVAIGDMVGLLGYAGIVGVTAGIGLSRASNGAIVGGIFNFDDTAGTPSVGIQAREDTQFINNALQTVIIKAGGNVGIGTATPISKLAIDLGAVNLNDRGITIEQNLAVVNAGSSISWRHLAATNDYAKIVGQTDSGGSGGVLSFYTNVGLGAVVDTEKMRIDRLGNVGIGTTTPGVRLEVAGDIKVAGGAKLLATTAALTNGAAAALGTLANAPAVGNPTKWIAIDDAGVVRHIPAW